MGAGCFMAALKNFLHNDWLLLVSIATVAAFWRWGIAIFALQSNPLFLILIFIWLFSVILASALAVVRHADALAGRLGEPYGTLILTLSVTAVEVMSISAVMLHGANNPTLVRDTLFAVVMIILNGMVGLSLLVGGLRHAEQHYNLQGANAFLGVIIPLSVFSLIMPDFTQTTPGPTLFRASADFPDDHVGGALLRVPRDPDRTASRFSSRSAMNRSNISPKCGSRIFPPRRAAARLHDPGRVARRKAGTSDRLSG